MKKLISLIMALVMLLSCFAVTSFAEEKREFTRGDLNRDGKYNLRDVSFILKYLAKWDFGPDTEQIGIYSDVNEDGKTNLLDAGFYLKWLSGWGGYLIG
ncbi:MAG: hypothetical protein J6L96_09110 [Clostridia bacterium]|nr:hypothetical protein [Clostridia bacterium]